MILNHLWQSTAFAACIAVLCLALRNNHARTRYWLWLAASVKFLLPFSLLLALGSRVEIPAASPRITAMAVETISVGFSPVPITPGPARSWWPMALGVVWAFGAVVVLCNWTRRWLSLRRIARRARPVDVPFALPVRATDAEVEPGVFGVVRPVLLLPAELGERLTPEQFEAILSHERCHVRYRDNLTAAVHMVASAIFWFHPLLWWIGARLVEERERACDESVVQCGGQATTYAESIVQVCRYYIESPLACAPGVTGSDVTRRIAEILSNRRSLRLTRLRKFALAAVACSAVTLPAMIGLLRAQTLPPPPQYGYDVVSIRASAPGETNSRIGPGPQGGLKTQNVSTLQLLTFAYDVREFQLVDVPGWVRDSRYDVSFTPDKPEEIKPDMGREKMEGLFNRQRQRMQAVLRDRFSLVLRAETRTLPMYSLVEAKGGHKLSAPKQGGPPHMRNSPGKITANGMYLNMFTSGLASMVGRHVSNDSGLDGPFDFEMTWSPDGNGEGSSIFTALTEQLGLKLESKRGPVPVFVIEKIEKPGEN
ncbi:MAG: M56 family metallopeptidase [Bryobacteraceae bacterium]